MGVDIRSHLQRCSEQVNLWLDRLVPGQEAYPEIIHRAMRYSLFAGGKRLRPTLTITTGEMFGADTDLIMPLSCAIEMIHTYSLIHDDLPAMDNDDMRRGRPTCHKVFGEAIALLAGDALLTRAFQALAEMNVEEALLGRKIRLIAELAAAAGTVNALIGGQVVDLESQGKETDKATLDYIHRSKTGAMIRASVRCGAIAGGASDDEIEVLTVYGEKIGLAFQITDDLLDRLATSQELGKTAGKDQAVNKATYPAIYGVDASREHAARLIDEAIAALQTLDRDTKMLQAIAYFVINRGS